MASDGKEELLVFGLWLVLDRKSDAGRQTQANPQFDVDIEVLPVETCDIDKRHRDLMGLS